MPVCPAQHVNKKFGYWKNLDERSAWFKSPTVKVIRAGTPKL